MRSIALFGILALGASALAGCPIYGDDPGTTGGSGGSQGNWCNEPSDCGENETCGEDGYCHPGDCTIWGCNAGYTCEIDSNTLTASCVPSGTGGSGGTAGAGGSAGSGGGGTGGSGPVVYCGNPDDCAAGTTCGPDGTCQPGDCVAVGCIYGFTCNAIDGECKPGPNACGEDADCAGFGAGYLCVSGICTAPADQCVDQTQCGSGQKCAAGKCTDGCTADADCSAGFLCNVELGICNVPAEPCTITNDCGSADQVCVDGACVPRSDGGTCDPGDVWVENGCIPNQSGVFVCNVDGQQDVCAQGSICLHKSCYISCEPPNQNVCDGLIGFNQCKSVTTSSGAHSVCGSSENLGSECDPQLGQGCAIGICIDGYCK